MNFLSFSFILLLKRHVLILRDKCCLGNSIKCCNKLLRGGCMIIRALV